ncbi:MAG: STAS domain-containing protein [Chloroflexales bacterium]|nr:STAS domain-containing protein [Chloroflexales bacterium]
MSASPLARLLTVAHSDPDVQRRAQLLVVVDLIMIAFIATASLLLLLQPGQRGAIAALYVIIAVLAGSLLLAARARVTTAASLLLAPLLAGPVLVVLVRGSVIVTLFFLTLSVFVGSLVLRPRQVWAVGLLSLAGLGLVRASVGPNPVDGALYPNLILGPAFLIILSTLFGYLGARASYRALEASRRAQEEADAARRSLEQSNEGLEAEVSARTAELRRALDEVGARAAAQEQLLAEVTAQREAIRDMSVPVLPVSSTTLVLPLIGALDSARLHVLQAQALTAVEGSRARRLVLDITGVPIVDTQVARGILETIEALRLLGVEPVLVGIRPEVAQTIVGLGLQLDGVRTAATLQAALADG